MGASQKSIKLFCFLYCILMFLFTFYDLPLSKALYTPDCVWAVFIQSYGTFPIMCVGIFCCIALMKTQQAKRKSALIIKIAYVLMLLHYVCYYMLTVISPLLFTEVSAASRINRILLLLVSIITSYIIFCSICIKRLCITNHAELTKIAHIGFYLCLGSTLLTDIIKYIWMRERFCNLTNPDTEFTMWFIPQLLSGNLASSSFPSGHVAQASCIIWCTLLPKVIPALNSCRFPHAIYIFSFLYIFFVMYSRILLGKHYATDVLTGMMITVLLFYKLYYYTYSSQANQKETKS